MKNSAWNCSGWKRPRIPKPFKRELDFKTLLFRFYLGRGVLYLPLLFGVFFRKWIWDSWDTGKLICVLPMLSLWGSVSIFLGMQVRCILWRTPVNHHLLSISLSCDHSKPDWLKGRLWGSSIPEARHEPRFCLATPYFFLTTNYNKLTLSKFQDAEASNLTSLQLEVRGTVYGMFFASHSTSC